MKSSSFPNDGPLPNDKAAMVDAIKALQDAGIRFERPTIHQLKVDSWNFYPARGTIFRDGAEKAERDTGVASFIARVQGASPAPKAASKQSFQPTIVR